MPDPTFTTLPPAPSRAVPSTFSARTDPFLAGMVVFQGELNTAVSWFSSTTSTVAINAATASAAATSAAASATLASAASGAVLHVPSASYTAGDAAISNTDYAAYRCILTHTGVATDPSADATNWTLAVPAGGLVPISTATISTAVAAVDISLAGYSNFICIIDGLAVATDNAFLYTRFSTDGGSTFDSGATDYNAQSFSTATAGSDSAQMGISQTGIGNATGEDLFALVNIVNIGATKKARMFASGTFTVSSGEQRNINPFGRHNNAGADAIRFFASAGNLTAGTFRLYGVTEV
jgi:hypothetical protein